MNITLKYKTIYFAIKKGDFPDLFKNDKKRLDDISRNGKNIDIRNEKYAIYWLLEIIPEYPHNYNFSNKYKRQLSETAAPLRSM